VLLISAISRRSSPKFPHTSTAAWPGQPRPRICTAPHTRPHTGHPAPSFCLFRLAFRSTGQSAADGNSGVSHSHSAFQYILGTIRGTWYAADAPSCLSVPSRIIQTSNRQPSTIRRRPSTVNHCVSIAVILTPTFVSSCQRRLPAHLARLSFRLAFVVCLPVACHPASEHSLLSSPPCCLANNNHCSFKLPSSLIATLLGHFLLPLLPSHLGYHRGGTTADPPLFSSGQNSNDFLARREKVTTLQHRYLFTSRHSGVSI
jgi:hypothetical protein